MSVVFFHSEKSFGLVQYLLNDLTMSLHIWNFKILNSLTKNRSNVLCWICFLPLFFHPRILTLLSFRALRVTGLIGLDTIVKQMEKILLFIIWFHSLGILGLIYFSTWFSEYPANFIFAIKMQYNFISKYDLTKTWNGIHLPKLLDMILSIPFVSDLKKSMLLQFNACLIKAGELEILYRHEKW